MPLVRRGLLATVVLVVAACSSAPSPVPASSAAAGASDPTGVVPVVHVVTGGLDAPLDVADAGDGSGRIFVAEQAGRIRIVRDGTLVERPLLDITGRIASGGERGLLGIAFHPGYPTDPRVFVDYTDKSGNTVVSSSGPSWRFIMDWGADAGYGVYPGGQSENPLSPWYENQIAAWWDGKYYPMLDARQAAAQSGAITWTLEA